MRHEFFLFFFCLSHIFALEKSITGSRRVGDSGSRGTEIWILLLFLLFLSLFLSLFLLLLLLTLLFSSIFVHTSHPIHGICNNWISWTKKKNQRQSKFEIFPLCLKSRDFLNKFRVVAVDNFVDEVAVVIVVDSQLTYFSMSITPMYRSWTMSSRPVVTNRPQFHFSVTRATMTE